MKVKRITPEQYLALAELGIPVRAYGYSVPHVFPQSIVDSPDSYEWAKRMTKAYSHVSGRVGRINCYTVVDDDEPTEEG